MIQNLKEEMVADQEEGMLAMVIDKMAPRLLKKLREKDEEVLREGFRKIAKQVLEAVDPPPPVQEDN